MRNGRLTYTPAAADADGYALSQTIASAGELSLNGPLGGSHDSICIIREARDAQPRSTTGASLVTVTSLGSDESGITITISGANSAGGAQSEVVTGPAASATVSTIAHFATVTSIVTSGALVGSISVGTSIDQVTPPLRPSQHAFEPFIIQTDLTGTLTYSLDATADSSPIETSDISYVTMCDFKNRTQDVLGNIITPLGAIRMNITAYTSGSVVLILGEATHG